MFRFGAFRTGTTDTCGACLTCRVPQRLHQRNMKGLQEECEKKKSEFLQEKQRLLRKKQVRHSVWRGMPCSAYRSVAHTPARARITSVCIASSTSRSSPRRRRRALRRARRPVRRKLQTAGVVSARKARCTRSKTLNGVFGCWSKRYFAVSGRAGG